MGKLSEERKKFRKERKGIRYWKNLIGLIGMMQSKPIRFVQRTAKENLVGLI